MREINKKEIQTMDTPNLTKMRNIIRDKWTWETGSDEDKEFLDFIESELNNREALASVPEPFFEIIGESLKFNGAELFEKSYDYATPIAISDDLAKVITKMITNNIKGYSYVSYDDQNIGISILQKVESEIHGDLQPSLETLIRTIVTTELSDFENRMREDFRCQLDTLKFELNK